MKRKNNWNLLGVIVLIAMCAFMFISCQQGPTLNPYKTLTLDIEGQQQKLYYGDGAWYSKLSDNGLLLDENKVTGDDVKFTISETTKWTVTFKKNIPNGASESDFTITPASVDVTSELSLSPDNVIDITTGKVSVDSIDGDKVITGTYPPTIIGKSVTASSTNTNYEFEKWTVKGVTIDNLADYKVSGDTEVDANWNCLADLKVLTIKDGDERVDTAYYNTKDRKWYAGSDTTSGEKTSVRTPSNREYTITLNYDNDTPNGSEPVTSSFLGYGVDDNTSAVIKPNGLLKDYTIENDTVLVSLWSKEKFNKPSDPTRDGYVFNGWYNGDDAYSFDSVVTGDMTLVAHWKEKPKKLTVKDGVNEKDTAWYSREDNKWYADENMTGEKTSVKLPEVKEKTYTITLKYNNKSEDVTSPLNSTFSGYGLSGADIANIPASGEFGDYTIENDTELVSKWDEVKITKPENPTRDGYVFNGWYNGDDEYNFDSVVTGDITLVAHWKEKLKKLTVKDGVNEIDTAWYNSEDTKWYADENMTGEKTSVRTLPNREYTITLNYDNGSSNGSGTATSSFSGYEDGSEVKVQADGLLSGYTINSDTILFAKWSKEKYSEPSQPTRDGYVFNGWYNGESLYNFDSVVEGNMTITAHWTKKTFNTLTLDIAGQQQKLYYGSDNAWYSDVVVKGEDQLLLVDNKVTGENIKFNIPSDPTWTVTFNKNTPAGAKDNEISISRESVEVVPELSLSPNNVIDITTGEVLKSSISENVIVTGTYPPKAIGQDKDITASSTNKNYEFDKWTTEGGEEITDITSYPVSGNITIKATWNNISDFKVLAVKDGDKIVETVYYYTDGKWYKERSTTSEVITSVALPVNTTKTYTITLNYDNGSDNGSEKVTSSFRGYGLDGSIEPLIQADGLLKDYTIENDTELVSKWKEAKFTKPENPTRDGYLFDKWYNGDVEYNFDSVVEGDMTLTAHWKEKPKKLTVKDRDVVIDTAYYNLTDKKWYANENMTDEKTSVEIPQDRTYTLTLDYANDSPNGNGGSVTSSFRGYGTNDNTSPVIGINGSLSAYTISDATELVSLWSEVQFNEPSEQPAKDGYVFDKWYKDGSPYDFNSVVTGNMTITAHWTKKTFNTLTLNITGSNAQTLYYGSDNVWYKALGEGDLLLEANKVTGDLKFIIPSDPVWTVTLNKNRPQNAPFSDADIILSKNQLTLYPKDGVFSPNADEYIYKDGIVKVPSITDNVNVTLDTSRRYPSENVEATISRDDIKFLGWKIGDQTITDLSTYEVTADNTILNASWGYKASIGPLDSPPNGVHNANRGFYTELAEIEDFANDESKQKREEYYAEGEWIHFFYDSSGIWSMKIILKNEWSGETKQIESTTWNFWKIVNIDMPNQPISISFDIPAGGEPV